MDTLSDSAPPPVPGCRFPVRPICRDRFRGNDLTFDAAWKGSVGMDRLKGLSGELLDAAPDAMVVVSFGARDCSPLPSSVIFTILASATFDSQLIWEGEEYAP